MSWRLGKWSKLILECDFDKVEVPIFKASARGKQIPLLKTLLSNYCTNQCMYCPFRLGCSKEKLTWDLERLTRVTFKLWKDRRIEGLFLSSSIPRDPDQVVEWEVEVAERLRKMGFNGYIHLRLMPGTSRDLIWRAAEVADRIGVNLEAPTRDIFDELAPGKADYRNDILKRLEWASQAERALRDKGRLSDYGYLKAGIDTQMIIGAVEEDKDMDYVLATYDLYRKLGLRRVYYSGFRPVRGTPLEDRPPCPSERELRLYRVSFLIRDYGFSPAELSSIMQDGMLPNEDPKLAFAQANPHLYPIDPNEATFEELLKVPGIGPIGAKKLLRLRDAKGCITVYDVMRVLGRARARLAVKYLDVRYQGLV